MRITLTPDQARHIMRTDEERQADDDARRERIYNRLLSYEFCILSAVFIAVLWVAFN